MLHVFLMCNPAFFGIDKKFHSNLFYPVSARKKSLIFEHSVNFLASTKILTRNFFGMNSSIRTYRCATYWVGHDLLGRWSQKFGRCWCRKNYGVFQQFKTVFFGARQRLYPPVFRVKKGFLSLGRVHDSNYNWDSVHPFHGPFTTYLNKQKVFWKKQKRVKNKKIIFEMGVFSF